VTLSNASLPENAPANTLVGVLSTTDPDAGDTHTYSLPAGVAANDLYLIDGNKLRSRQPFDYETQSTYHVSIRTTDQGGLSFDTQNTAITVTNVNEAPTAVTLSSDSLPENAPPDTIVGVLTTTDADVGDTHTYSLPAGVEANAYFWIDGN